VVLLEPERDVEEADGSKAIELCPLSERDRAPGVAPVLANPEAQVLPVADGRRRDGLGRGDEEGDVGVAQAEGRHPRELLCEVERQVARGDHGVDCDDLEGVVEGDVLVGVPGEGVGERWDVLLGDRETGRRSVPAESLEVARARREPRVQVEARNRATRALPRIL
jgi:hypothetical protein